MRRPKDYKPIEFRQLCAIVKTILQQEPSIDDAEWKARTLDTLAKWEFAEPESQMLEHALTQVEQALKTTVGPRPLRPVPVPALPSAPPVIFQPEQRTSRPAGWEIVVALMAKLRGSSASEPSSPSAPGPIETLKISEEAALDEFWKQMREGSDRLSLLRAFAEVAIVRPAGWDYLKIRAHAHEHALHSDGCFVCRSSGIDWHHVIQIQFGGSNYLRNRVPLCGPCHSAVHPWLPEVRRNPAGWTHLSGCSPAEFDAIHRKASA